MEKINTPAEQTVPEAGQEVVADTSEQSDTRLTEAFTIIDGLDKELTQAQKKIRHLSKSQIEEGEDEDLRNTVSELQEQIAELKQQKDLSKEADSSELAKLRTRAAELRASLLAKQSISNNSAGSNQDKPKVEVDPLKGLNASQIALYERLAAKKGITVQEYIQKFKKT